MWPAIHFHVRVDKVVQPVAGLWRFETNVAPHRELHAVGVDRPKEVVALLRVEAGLGGVDRHPAVTVEIELSPAVIALDAEGGAVWRHGKADDELRRNPDGARETGEEGMEVGAVTRLCVARPVDVPVTPTRATLVVAHRRHDVVVDGARLLKIGRRAACDLIGHRADASVERDQAVRRQPAWVRWGGNGAKTVIRAFEPSVDLFVPRHVKAPADAEGPALGVGDRQVQNRVAELCVPRHRCRIGRHDVESRDTLMVITLRRRHPHLECASTVRDRIDRGDVRQLERALADRRICPRYPTRRR